MMKGSSFYMVLRSRWRADSKQGVCSTVGKNVEPGVWPTKAGCGISFSGCLSKRDACSGIV